MGFYSKYLKINKNIQIVLIKKLKNTAIKYFIVEGFPFIFVL